MLEELLAAWIGRQRWFGGKGRPIDQLSIDSDVELSPGLRHLIIAVWQEGSRDRYQVLLGERNEMPDRLNHALIGTIGVVMSRNNPMGARNFLMGFGLLYIVLSVYALIVGVGSVANFLSLNVMGAWGFMILGVAMVLAGWLMSRHLADDAKTR